MTTAQAINELRVFIYLLGSTYDYCFAVVRVPKVVVTDAAQSTALGESTIPVTSTVTCHINCHMSLP